MQTTLILGLLLVACTAYDASVDSIVADRFDRDVVATKIDPVPVHGRYRRQYADPLTNSTYRSGVEYCYFHRRGDLAALMGAPDDAERIARAYSLGVQEGPYRDAAYVGCLEGIVSPGAGQHRPYDERNAPITIEPFSNLPGIAERIGNI